MMAAANLLKDMRDIGVIGDIILWVSSEYGKQSE